MPGQTTKLTEREKAVIFAYVAGIIDDPKIAYIAADEKPQRETEKQVSLNTSVSRWLHCDKVTKTIEQFRQYFADRDAEQRRKGREETTTAENDDGQENKEKESKRTQPEKKKTTAALVDYSSPENRKRLYNEVIRDAADDPKTRLDAAKVFEQIQRDDKQAAKDNQIQRFYTPIRCKGCALYLRQEERRRKKL